MLLLSFLTLLTLGPGCSTPDPRAELMKVVGDTAREVPERSVWMALTPEAIEIGTVGPWPAAHPDLVHSLSSRARLELVDGRPPEEELRGQLISNAYEVLLELAESSKQLERDTDGEVVFDGTIWLFVDRRTQDATMSEAMFTAGQAQFGHFHIVGMGPQTTPPEEPFVEPMSTPSPWERPTPLSPVRHGLTSGQHTFTIDDRPATFRIEVPEQDGFIAVRRTGLVDRATRERSNPRLFATYAEAAEHARYPVLPSVEMLLHVAKDVDDRLIVAATRGREDQRQRWIEDSAQAAREAGKEAAAEFLETGAALGRGEEPPGAAQFLNHAIESEPVGVYAEHDDLAAVFRRDRWLMRKLDSEPLATQLVEHLSDDPFLAEEARIRAVWTNPPDPRKPLLSRTERPTWVVPGARSHETELVNRLGGSAIVPDPMDAFVDAILDGSVDLSPREDSGWYDRQQWAIEPLLTLENDKLSVNDGYRERLRRAFEAAVTMRRETAVKDLSIPAIGAGAGPPVVMVAPALRVEPLPMVYARHAEAYRWSSEHLPEHQPPAVAEQVRAETRQLATFFGSLAAISRVDLGMAVGDSAAKGGAEGEPVELLDPSDGAPRMRGTGLGMTADQREEAERHSKLLSKLIEGDAPSGSLRTVSDPEPDAEAGEPETVGAPGSAGSSTTEPLDVTATVAWLDDWAQDPVLGQDVRVFVPFGEDADGSVIGWALLGVHAIDLVVRYDQPPAVTFTGDKRPVQPIEARYSVLVPMFTELHTQRVWNRADLRQTGDEHPTALELIAALEQAPAE